MKERMKKLERNCSEHNVEREIQRRNEVECDKQGKRRQHRTTVDGQSIGSQKMNEVQRYIEK